MCSKNVHRVLPFYFNGNYHRTCSIVLLIKSCGPSICYDIILLTWLGQKAGTCMLPDKPGTWKIVAQLFLRIPLWAGALTLSPGDWHLREQPNDWPRHFFRKWLTKAANLDNHRRAPIKALWPSILPPGLGTLTQTHKWKKNHPLRNKQHLYSMHCITQPYYTLFIIPRCILNPLLKCCIVSLVRLVFRTFLFPILHFGKGMVNLEENINEGVFLELTKTGTILK